VGGKGFGAGKGKQMMRQLPESTLTNCLPVLQRLALAYAPAAARGPILGLLALDVQLAGIVRSAREPVLAQLRLAWWRDQLAHDPGTWPKGEPVLAALTGWPGHFAALARLTDGWEALTDTAPLPKSAFETLANARAEAFASLAQGKEAQANTLRLARNWALGDIAAHLGNQEERRVALELALAQDWRWARLPRALRPLAVLHEIAARNLARGRVANHVNPGILLAAARMGLLGR
jgi:15-cis-phytoene synthase